MHILLGDTVHVEIRTEGHGDTEIIGTVISTGYLKTNPDAFWFEIAGLTSRLYSDEVKVVKIG